jgi:hypothetical protein
MVHVHNISEPNYTDNKILLYRQTQHKPHCTQSKRPRKDPQNWRPYKAHSQLEQCTNIQISQIPSKDTSNTRSPLPFAFNIKNTVQLISDLKNIPVNRDVRLASFDISNMYTNFKLVVFDGTIIFYLLNTSGWKTQSSITTLSYYAMPVWNICEF